MAGSSPGPRAQGFRTVLVSEADHPFWEHCGPHHRLGDPAVLRCWRRSATAAWLHPAFEDGYRAAEVCDAIVRSSESGAREAIRYR